MDYPKEGELIEGFFQLLSLIQSIQLIKTSSVFFISIVCLAPHIDICRNVSFDDVMKYNVKAPSHHNVLVDVL